MWSSPYAFTSAISGAMRNSTYQISPRSAKNGELNIFRRNWPLVTSAVAVRSAVCRDVGISIAAGLRMAPVDVESTHGSPVDPKLPDPTSRFRATQFQNVTVNDNCLLRLYLFVTVKHWLGMGFTNDLNITDLCVTHLYARGIDCVANHEVMIVNPIDGVCSHKVIAVALVVICNVTRAAAVGFNGNLCRREIPKRAVTE